MKERGCGRKGRGVKGKENGCKILLMRKRVVNRLFSVFAWLKDSWLEAKSWGRWFWNYLLPMALSWPLKFPLFLWLLRIEIILSILSLPLQLPFADRLLQSIEDWLVLNFGQSSWDIVNLLVGIPALILLTLWLLINSIWADRKRKFFERIDQAGLYLVRSGGKRLAFLERMCAKNKVMLGLGKANRILPIYAPIEEEIEILNFLEQEKNSPNAIITGPSTAGKTRTGLELIYRFNPNFVIIWPKGAIVESNQFAALPKISGKNLVFADDISLALAEGKPSLSPAMQALLRVGDEFRLLATRRLDEMPKELAGATFFELEEEENIEKYSSLFRAVAKEEGISAQEVAARFAGHPGSVVANLDSKKQLWDNHLPESCQRILQAEKLMWQEGVRNIDIERILGALEDLWNIKGENSNIDNCLHTLEEQGFISREGDEISVYPGYRDNIVLLPSVPANPSEKLLEGFERRGDGESLFALAYLLQEEYSGEYQANPRIILKKVLDLYLGALRFRTEKAAPLDYAMTQNNLGVAYGNLARYEQPVENLKAAIAAYGEALRFYTEKTAPLDYAMTQNNLGTAYRNLAGYEQAKTNLKLALEAWKEALRVYSGRLPEGHQNIENLKNAIASLKEKLNS